MLRFKIPPDAVFQAILRRGIANAIQVVSDLLEFFNHDDDSARQEFTSLFPEIGRIFLPSAARTALENIGRCLDRPDVYECTEYHYLLLYDVLNFYAAVHNGLVVKSKNRNERKAAALVDPFLIETINVDEMVDIYFFDQNFLLDSETLMDLPATVRESLRPELFGLCAGLPPHPEELELKIQTSADRNEYRIQSPQFFGPKSKVYPDFDYFAAKI